MIDICSNLYTPASFMDSGGQPCAGNFARCLWKPALETVLGGKSPCVKLIQPNNNLLVSDTVTLEPRNDGECQV